MFSALVMTKINLTMFNVELFSKTADIRGKIIDQSSFLLAQSAFLKTTSVLTWMSKILFIDLITTHDRVEKHD